MPRKFDYLYVLQGEYGHGWEDLTAEDQAGEGGKIGARRRIRQSRREYAENEGGHYRIIQRRELAAA